MSHKGKCKKKKGILLSHKKEWNKAICITIDGTRDHHTKLNKSDRESQVLYHLYVEPKILYKWTYLQNRNIKKKYQKQNGNIPTERENKFMVTMA